MRVMWPTFLVVELAQGFFCLFPEIKGKIEESARKEACARERTIPLARKALTREAPHAHLAHTSFSPSLITGNSFTTHKNVMSFVRQKTWLIPW